MILIVLYLMVCMGCLTSEPAQIDTGHNNSAVTATATPPANKDDSAQKTRTSSTNQPKIIKGGEFCEDYLLKKIDTEKDSTSVFSELKFNPKDKSLSAGIKNWLDTADRDKLEANRLEGKGKNVLLLHSQNTAATGLAANLEYWIIQNGDKALEFQSFSKNPKLIWLDKDGAINYYSVVYSDEFIDNKDWDNLTFKIEKYKVNSIGESKLIETENNLKCE